MPHASEWQGWVDKGPKGDWDGCKAHYEVIYRHVDEIQFNSIESILDVYGFDISKAHETKDGHCDLHGILDEVCESNLHLSNLNRMIANALMDLTTVPGQILMSQMQLMQGAKKKG